MCWLWRWLWRWPGGQGCGPRRSPVDATPTRWRPARTVYASPPRSAKVQGERYFNRPGTPPPFSLRTHHQLTLSPACGFPGWGIPRLLWRMMHPHPSPSPPHPRFLVSGRATACSSSRTFLPRPPGGHGAWASATVSPHHAAWVSRREPKSLFRATFVEEKKRAGIRSSEICLEIA